MGGGVQLDGGALGRVLVVVPIAGAVSAAAAMESGGKSSKWTVKIEMVMMRNKRLRRRGWHRESRAPEKAGTWRL